MKNRKARIYNIKDNEELFLGEEENNLEKFRTTCCNGLISIEPLCRAVCGECGKELITNKRLRIKIKKDKIEIFGKIERESEVAILFNDGLLKGWLPKSMIEIGNKNKYDQTWITVPEWLAKDKEFFSTRHFKK